MHAALAALMRFMSDFREAMWGVVQQAISELDFDFVAYADEHFERLERTAADAFRRRSREERARAVVIGGGVGGCSILYWLARLGWDDVVLVERADLTSGSTFHSAGLVGQLRGSLSLTRMMMDSVELYRTLGDEVGLETGWHEVGLAAARVVGGADGGAAPPGRLGEDVRAAARARSRPRRRSGSSRRCRPTACSAPRTCRPTATSTRASSRSRWRRVHGAAAPRSTRTRG